MANKGLTQELEDIEDLVEIQRMILSDLNFPPSKEPSLGDIKDIKVGS